MSGRIPESTTGQVPVGVTGLMGEMLYQEERLEHPSRPLLPG